MVVQVQTISIFCQSWWTKSKYEELSRIENKWRWSLRYVWMKKSTVKLQLIGISSSHNYIIVLKLSGELVKTKGKEEKTSCIGRWVARYFITTLCSFAQQEETLVSTSFLLRLCMEVFDEFLCIPQLFLCCPHCFRRSEPLGKDKIHSSENCVAFWWT